MRLASLVVTLVVLAMLIGKAADPATWGWLVGEQPAANEANPPTVPLEPVARPAEPIVPGPTDDDPEERAAASEQFQALTDGGTELGREEMPAYWRLFSWAEHQSLQELTRRSDGNVVLNQFIRSPEEHRGKLFRLDLNVRRVLSYDAPENSAGIKKVYEVWGFTTESQAWLYCVLTAHLPPGMPTGPNVSERVSFAGYFLKVQGYHAAGAGPKDKALAAPLLIGRLSWQQAPSLQPAAEPQWLWWLGGLALVFVAARFALWAASRLGLLQPRAQSSPRETRSASLVKGWLAQAETNNAEETPLNERAYEGNGNHSRRGVPGAER